MADDRVLQYPASGWHRCSKLTVHKAQEKYGSSTNYPRDDARWAGNGCNVA
jgi:hypothetical protein